MKTLTKPVIKNRRYAVAYLHNGKFVGWISKRSGAKMAIRLANEINDNMSGSPLMAVVVPHAMKGGAR